MTLEDIQKKDKAEFKSIVDFMTWLKQNAKAKPNSPKESVVNERDNSAA